MLIRLLFMVFGILIGILLTIDSPVTFLLFVMCAWSIIGMIILSEGMVIKEVGATKLLSVLAVGVIVTAGSIRIYDRALQEYRQNPSFYAKVNAYVFMDPVWQSRLDLYWFQKQRIRIDQNKDNLQDLRRLCAWNFAEVARTFNMRVDAYNQAVVGSMVGLQYAEPVEQLLIQRFDDHVAPCGDETSPHWSPYQIRKF